MTLQKKHLKVLFLSAEADPFVKIGGLGDVAGSLPPALRAHSYTDRQNGHTVEYELDVRLVLPYHGEIQQKNYPIRSVSKFSVPYKGEGIVSEGLTRNNEQSPVYFISSPLIPMDTPVYSGDDQIDGVKYVFFSLAALQFVRELNWKPDIIHANDWHTAISLYALTQNRGKDNFFSNTSTVIGIHNLPYYGPHVGPLLNNFGISPAEGSNLPDWAQDIPLPLGLITADHIVTVSPTYAKEIQSPEYGAGLDQFLRSRNKVISGILNGIDVGVWDPKEDPNLVEKYDFDTLENRISNKIALQGEFGLDRSEQVPLIGMVTRMDHQKGVDLIPEALRRICKTPEWVNRDWQLVLLGTGDPELEAEVRLLAGEFRDQVKVDLRYDAGLSHRIYSGADLLLIPSRYEPCGLTQMIAMRYGCIPIGRATGGLNDTIQDYFACEDSTGFLFSQATPESLANTIAAALKAFEKKRKWKALQNRAMNRDFSWARSAQLYMQLYLDLYSRKVLPRGNDKKTDI